LRQFNERQGASKAVDLIKWKLPTKFRDCNIIALNAEDHYVRVYTDKGNYLILMSFENALIAVAGYRGVRTHRSWWISIDAISHKQNINSIRTKIMMSQNLEVPISRRRKESVLIAIKNNDQI